MQTTLTARRGPGMIASIRSTDVHPLACEKYRPGRSRWQALPSIYSANNSRLTAMVAGSLAGLGVASCNGVTGLNV
jgi:hypothetical protein